MAANPLIFKNSEDVKKSITSFQKMQISDLYSNWAKDLGNTAKKYQHKTASSYWVKQKQAEALKKTLEKQSIEVTDEALGIIKDNMYQVADAVVKDAIKFAEQMGFSSEGVSVAYSSIPDYAIKSLITGNVYETGWSLSDRIWSSNDQIKKQAYEVVAGGLAQNKSIYEICKDLEKYVQPGAKKPWNLIAPDGKKIYPKQVDYNAQRLARTLAQHTYQQSFVAVTKENPFILKYQWLANGSRVCPLCADRDGQYFEKDDLPLDHPNGMCTMVPVEDPELENKLVNWINGEDGDYPEIDTFAESLGYKPSPLNQTTIDAKMSKLVDKYGTSSANKHTGWLKKLTPQEKVQVKSYKDKLGMTWNDFYKKYWYKAKESKIQAIKKRFEDALYSAKEKASALRYKTRRTADKYLRPILDSKWDNLRYREKYSVWEYTQNSHPINKSLSGYHDGWQRSDFVGLGKTKLGHEDSWRYFETESFKNKFGVNGHKDYKSVVQNLTNGIEKTELEKSMYVLRRSDESGLAGWFEQSPMGFDNAFDILKNGTEEEIKQAFIGQVGTNHSFTSVGIAEDAQFPGNIKYEIFAPQGTKAIYAEPASYYGETVGMKEEIYNAGKAYYYVGHEAEVILQRGTSFRITDIEKSGSNLLVKCEIVDQPDYFKTGLEMTHNGGKTVWTK